MSAWDAGTMRLVVYKPPRLRQDVGTALAVAGRMWGIHEHGTCTIASGRSYIIRGESFKGRFAEMLRGKVVLVGTGNFRERVSRNDSKFLPWAIRSYFVQDVPQGKRTRVLCTRSV